MKQSTREDNLVISDGSSQRIYHFDSWRTSETTYTNNASDTSATEQAVPLPYSP